MVEKKVIKILSKYGNLDASQINSKSSLESLGIDSVAMVEIIFEIEEEFEIKFKLKELNNLNNVGNLLNIINEKIK